MKTVIIREMTALIMRPTSPPSLTNPPHAKSRTHIRFEDDHNHKKPSQKHEKDSWRAHARYYAAITFNQIVLSTSDADRAVARSLIEVYFKLFREVVGEQDPEHAEDAAPVVEEPKDKRDKKPKPKKKGVSKEVRGAAGFCEVQDSNARLLGAILTGVNRAMPYARFGGADLEYAIFFSLSLNLFT